MIAEATPPNAPARNGRERSNQTEAIARAVNDFIQDDLLAEAAPNKNARNQKVTVEKRVGENGQLFGSVTTNEIADALVSKGITVDKRRIELGHPIKSLGTHDVDVRLHREVSAHVQVEVVPLGTEAVESAPAATETTPQA